MSKSLYALINPVVKAVLRSPLHRLMSRNTMLLEFVGRKSGKVYCTPVSYYEKDNKVNCTTGKDNLWWRNLVNADSVEVTLRGRRRKGKSIVLPSGSKEVEVGIHDLLVASPRDASFAGVGFDADGQPNAADVKAASQKIVLISIDLL
jgi:deazaflavin-dependent oxidoreductase (nitroreductase family)